MGATLRRQGVREEIETAPGAGVQGTGAKAGMAPFSQKWHNPTIPPTDSMARQGALRGG